MIPPRINPHPVRTTGPGRMTPMAEWMAMGMRMAMMRHAPARRVRVGPRRE
jgi:hypothetical protein